MPLDEGATSWRSTKSSSRRPRPRPRLHRPAAARPRHRDDARSAPTPFAPLLQRLDPRSTVETRERFSQLSYAGPIKARPLPRARPSSRSRRKSLRHRRADPPPARRLRGGDGRLSPRTRNAQVDLYQAGEVDFLVATDAIGMGLNMDVDHVAFAALRKFDGTPAPLHSRSESARSPAAPAASARRTFGVTGEARGDPGRGGFRRWRPILRAPVAAPRWRNTELDFPMWTVLLDSLATALAAAPNWCRGQRRLRLRDPSRPLARESEPIRRARPRHAAGCGLLWEACQGAGLPQAGGRNP